MSTSRSRTLQPGSGSLSSIRPATWQRELQPRSQRQAMPCNRAVFEFVVHKAVHSLVTIARKLLMALATLLDLNLQTRVRFPVALPTHSIALSTKSPDTIFTRLWQFCGNLLHCLIPLVHRLPDLCQLRMAVDAQSVDTLMPHRIHHCHDVACGLHRIGGEAVPGTVENDRFRNPR